MTKDYSPFTPGTPVPLDFFVGRSQEIQTMVTTAKKAAALGSIERLFVLGERGIGKSSLCQVASQIVERQNLGVFPVHVMLGGVTTLEEMARRTIEAIISQGAKAPWYRQLLAFLGEHVRQVGLFSMSVEFRASQDELRSAAFNFGSILRNLLEKMENQKALMLILDDLNGLVTTEIFAPWLKSFVDSVAIAKEKLPLLLVLVGLSERRQQLIERHRSLDRVFDLLFIERFSRSETEDFFRRTFGSVNVQLQPEAIELLYRFSAGYPAFMQELGDAVFKADSDDMVTSEDALNGLFRGAQVLGAKYIEPNILAAIRSENYRVILKKITKQPFEHRFTRKTVVAGLTGAEAKVFDNFLRRMESLGVIRKDKDHGPGSYEFTSELYYLFFWLQTSTQSSKL
jgi:hypothetical protein